MRFRRSGKCVTCRIPVIQYREFGVDVDIFDADPDNYIHGDLTVALKTWRDERIYCEPHEAAGLQADRAILEAQPERRPRPIVRLEGQTSLLEA